MPEWLHRKMQATLRGGSGQAYERGGYSGGKIEMTSKDDHKHLKK